MKTFNQTHFWVVSFETNFGNIYSLNVWMCKIFFKFQWVQQICKVCLCSIFLILYLRVYIYLSSCIFYKPSNQSCRLTGLSPKEVKNQRIKTNGPNISTVKFRETEKESIFSFCFWVLMKRWFEEEYSNMYILLTTAGVLLYHIFIEKKSKFILNFYSNISYIFIL